MSEYKELDLIIDLGANIGANIPYYLMKSKKVVAVEANPVLADLIKKNFKHEILSERLVVENVAVTVESSGLVQFYTHKSNHVLSQILAPENDNDFEVCDVAAVNIIELLNTYVSNDENFRYYCKIDLENYDHVILRSMFDNNYFPTYISVESHSVEVLSQLVEAQVYSSFNVVEGSHVEKKYKKSRIFTNEGEKFYRFPRHSAGPFGSDIDRAWLTKQDLFKIMRLLNLGWIDIHATKEKSVEVLEFTQSEHDKLLWRVIRDELHRKILKNVFKRLKYKFRMLLD